MQLKALKAGALAVGLLGAMPALAQEPLIRKRFTVFVRGGAAEYTGRLGDFTKTGMAWGLGLGIQASRVLFFEVGYDGSRNLLFDDPLFRGPALIRHAGSGMLKVSVPLMKVRPFVAIGIGIAHASLSGEGGTFSTSDWQEEVPAAAGLEFTTGAVTVGARATYRLVLGENWANGADIEDPPNGGLLDASLTLGLRF